MKEDQLTNKERMTIAWRKRKDLCELCGRFLASESHECLENYVKADMRKEELAKKNIVVNAEIPTIIDEVKIADKIEIEEQNPDKQEDDRKDKRKKTIEAYRRKKNLCIRCGKDFNNDRLEGCDCHNYECEKNYEKSDMRPTEEKKEDPRTIETPREKLTTIQDEMVRENINKKFIKSSLNPFMHLEPTDNVKVLKGRPFILIDFHPSSNNQIITFEYLDYMRQKYKNYRICIIGDVTQIFTAIQVSNMKKFPNVYSLDNLMDQNIVDHLCACSRFFGFPSDYLTYCMTRGVNCTTFVKVAGLDIPCTIVSVDPNENVDLAIVARNTASYKL